jgi:hypothetical protein
VDRIQLAKDMIQICEGFCLMKLVVDACGRSSSAGCAIYNATQQSCTALQKLNKKLMNPCVIDTPNLCGNTCVKTQYSKSCITVKKVKLSHYAMQVPRGKGDILLILDLSSRWMGVNGQFPEIESEVRPPLCNRHPFSSDASVKVTFC